MVTGIDMCVFAEFGLFSIRIVKIIKNGWYPHKTLREDFSAYTRLSLPPVPLTLQTLNSAKIFSILTIRTHLQYFLCAPCNKVKI